jgi:hypothetical protein
LRAGEQHGLACRPGPAVSSADSTRDVKSMAVAGVCLARHGVRGCRGRQNDGGGQSAGLPLSGPDTPDVRGGRSVRDGAGGGSEPPRAGARALRQGAVIGTMDGGENDLFSGQCLWERGHGMRA